MNLLESMSCLKALSGSHELYESPKLCQDLLKIVSLLSNQNKEIQQLQARIKELEDQEMNDEMP